MAYVCLVIDVPNETIAQLNSDIQLPTKVYATIENCVNFLNGIQSGTKPASVQVTTRDTDPSISTSGTNSEQYTYSHL